MSTTKDGSPVDTAQREVQPLLVADDDEPPPLHDSSSEEGGDPVAHQGPVERAYHVRPATFSFGDLIKQWHRDNGTEVSHDATARTCMALKQEFAAHVVRAARSGGDADEMQFHLWCLEQLELEQLHLDPPEQVE